MFFDLLFITSVPTETLSCLRYVPQIFCLNLPMYGSCSEAVSYELGSENLQYWHLKRLTPSVNLKRRKNPFSVQQLFLTRGAMIFQVMERTTTKNSARSKNWSSCQVVSQYSTDFLLFLLLVCTAISIARYPILLFQGWLLNLLTSKPSTQNCLLWQVC